jgi:hypothetical protein
MDLLFHDVAKEEELLRSGTSKYLYELFSEFEWRFLELEAFTGGI